MPSKVTRTTGAIALVSAALWILSVIVLATASGFQDGMSMNSSWIVPVVLAVATFGIALLGVFRRAGGLRGWLPLAALAVAALGFLISVIGTWAWPVWGILLTVAGLLAVLRLRSARLGVTVSTRFTDWLLVAAWPLGIVVSILLSELHVGPLDEDGDYPVAVGAGFGVGALLFAIALVQIGRWLRSERPIMTTPATQAA